MERIGLFSLSKPFLCFHWVGSLDVSINRPQAESSDVFWASCHMTLVTSSTVLSEPRHEAKLRQTALWFCNSISRFSRLLLGEVKCEAGTSSPGSLCKSSRSARCQVVIGLPDVTSSAPSGQSALADESAQPRGIIAVWIPCGKPWWNCSSFIMEQVKARACLPRRRMILRPNPTPSPNTQQQAHNCRATAFNCFDYCRNPFLPLFLLHIGWLKNRLYCLRDCKTAKHRVVVFY